MKLTEEQKGYRCSTCSHIADDHPEFACGDEMCCIGCWMCGCQWDFRHFDDNFFPAVQLLCLSCDEKFYLVGDHLFNEDDLKDQLAS